MVASKQQAALLLVGVGILLLALQVTRRHVLQRTADSCSSSSTTTTTSTSRQQQRWCWYAGSKCSKGACET
jgi:hypothetical protein